MDIGRAYSLAALMFGCGVSSGDFKRHFDTLGQDDQEIIGKVAWRLTVANIIRYQLRFRVPFDIGDSWGLSEFNSSELPSLELFYLFGCLDTLAGSDHVQFPTWVEQEDKLGRLNLGVGQMDVHRLIQIFQTYQQQHGVGSRLRYVFSELPDATVDWLFTHTAVYKTMKGLEPSLDPSNRQRLTDQKKFLDHWRAFFYDLHRNPFAHQSTSQDVYLPEDMMWAYSSKPTGEWELRSGTMHYQLNGKWWSIEWKADTDESTVLRVLIEGTVLRRMGISVTAAIVKRYVRAQLRLRTFTGLRDEIDRNARRLQDWSDMAESNAELHRLQQSLKYEPLDIAWTSSAVDLYDTDHLRERTLCEATGQYLSSAREINARIEAFIEEHPPTSNEADRAAAVVAFWAEQRASEHYARIIDMPRHVEIIGHIDQTLGNPCHITLPPI